MTGDIKTGNAMTDNAMTGDVKAGNAMTGDVKTDNRVAGEKGRDVIWKILSTDANLELMSQVLGIKETTARVMANRGIRSKNTALSYLRGEGPAIDTLSMKSARTAFDRIARGIENGERIMIYGDYDADGVMATVIMYKSLRVFASQNGLTPDIHFYIPHREEEGYGLNIKAVRAIKEMDCDLIISVDNGISALEEISEANALGMDVIVIDHHEPGFVETVSEDEGTPQTNRSDVIPDAIAVIDPKQSACPYPFKEMCAAGLAFKLMEAFFCYKNRDFKIHDEMLVFAAIATICDIVDLMGENRILVKQGLSILNSNKTVNPGLGQLLRLRGYMDKPIDTFTVGFVIGPCINASGRLESAEMAVKLLLSSNADEQVYLSKVLSDLNDERKNMQRLCASRILEKAESDLSKVMVLVDVETHESIAGIVAGKVKETLHRPVIVLTRGTDKGVLKGSGRSIDGFNMFEALYSQRELLLRFGGHAMAAGMSLEETNVSELRSRLNDNCGLTDSDFRETVTIDCELPKEEITISLADELALLSPFGKSNHEPLFVTRNLEVSALRMIDNKNTMIFTFAPNIKGIAFGKNEIFLEDLRSVFDESDYRAIISGQVNPSWFMMDVVHAVEVNIYNGRKSVQMRIRDFKIRSEYTNPRLLTRISN